MIVSCRKLHLISLRSFRGAFDRDGVNGLSGCHATSSGPCSALQSRGGISW
jgi:hypothetical protein